MSQNLRWTPQQYATHLAKRKLTDRNRVQLDPAQPEKHEGHGKRPHVDRPKGKTLDESCRRQFAVTIEISFPDNIRRDIDGIANTILDVIIASRRRLVALYPELDDHGKAGPGRSTEMPGHD